MIEKIYDTYIVVVRTVVGKICCDCKSNDQKEISYCCSSYCEVGGGAGDCGL